MGRVRVVTLGGMGLEVCAAKDSFLKEGPGISLRGFRGRYGMVSVLTLVGREVATGR